MTIAWESELAQFLTDLSAVQDQSLALLSQKRERLAAADLQGLAALEEEEEQVMATLQECLARRAALLQRAASEGLPAEDLTSLATSLPQASQGTLALKFAQTSARARLLQHQSLVNWVVVQRTLIHLSQLLEIIATGGQMKPTYGKGAPVQPRGALVDQVI